MEFYAAIDTNVLISALLSKNEDSPTVKILEAVFDGKIIPLYPCIQPRLKYPFQAGSLL